MNHSNVGELLVAPSHLKIQPIRSNYRTLSIENAFDWSQIITDLRQSGRDLNEKLYLVVFRSVRKPGIDGSWVAELDNAAHTEALASPALLHYYAGNLDRSRRAISWCLWTGMADARRALSGEAHQRAVRAAREIYDTFSIEMHDVYIIRKRIIFDPVPRR